MILRIKYFLCSIMFILSATVTAQGPGWTATSTIKQIVVASNGGINVQLYPMLSGCVSQSGYGETFASIYPDHPGITRLQANLLAAALSGKSVALYLSDNTCKVLEMRLYL